MTATADRSGPVPSPPGAARALRHARARRLADQLVIRAGLRPRRRGVGPAQVAEALARVLAATPPGSDHGRLLAAALTPGKGPRPAEHQAVRRLLGRGELPTPGAVAGELDNLERRRQADAASQARIRAIVAADGPRAAAVVAERWRTTGAGPTWRELGQALGWQLVGAHPRRDRDRDRIMRELAAAGWLVIGCEPRSLRPGPRAESGADG